jgi:4'-phosphopantetheinyl transferase
MALVKAEPEAKAFEIPPGEIHLWLIDTTDEGFAGLDAQTWLDPQEVERARRLARYEDRLAFVRVHIGLRQILAGYLASLPHEVVYQYDCQVCGRRHGKPVATSLRHPEQVPFNLARSSTFGVVALVAAGPVGVDVERLDQEIAVDELAEFFTPAEREALAATPPADRTRAHLVTWTRKEAYTKALGIGLSLGLDQFEVSTPPEPPYLLRQADTDLATAVDEWTMAELPLPEPFVGTVVTTADATRLRTFTWVPRSGEPWMS